VTAVHDRRRRVTESQLADVMDLSMGASRRLIEEMQEAGLIEPAGDNFWRLTEHAERRFGACLRALEVELEDAA
jgi:DNA-binding IclR family transcriptional regulator